MEEQFLRNQIEIYKRMIRLRDKIDTINERINRMKKLPVTFDVTERQVRIKNET